MEVRSYLRDAALVVTLTGRAAGDDNLILRQTLAAMHAQGHRKIVIDLAELEYLDSISLGELVAFQVRATRLGALLKIANPDKRLQDLLVLTRLETVFQTYDTVEAAIESFAPAHPAS